MGVVVNPATRALGKRPHSFARVGRRSVQDDSKITWVTVLTFVVVYLISLVSVTLIGQGLFFGGQVPDHISTVFSPTFTTQCGRTSCMTSECEALEPLLNQASMLVL